MYNLEEDMNSLERAKQDKMYNSDFDSCIFQKVVNLVPW